MEKKKGKDRKVMRRFLAAVLACLLATVLCTGCGSAKGTDSGAATEMRASQDMAVGNAGGAMYPTEEAGVYESDVADSGTAEEGAGESAGVLEGRKLIQRARLEVETKEFEGMMSSLETQVQDMGGYIENMETYNGSSYSDYVSSRYADLTIRIPSGKLNAFLQTVSDIGNVVRRYNNVEDVTLSYVDMESRRNALRTEQERLLSFLGRAETIEEIIALEQRLSEVRYQLESMESQLRTMDNLIDYSTVELHVSEVKELTDVDQEEPGPGKRIEDGFMKSLRDIGDGLMELAIWFLAHIPYLAIWALAAMAVALLWKKARRLKGRGGKTPEKAKEPKNGPKNDEGRN